MQSQRNTVTSLTAWLRYTGTAKSNSYSGFRLIKRLSILVLIPARSFWKKWGGVAKAVDLPNLLQHTTDPQITGYSPNGDTWRRASQTTPEGTVTIKAYTGTPVGTINGFAFANASNAVLTANYQVSQDGVKINENGITLTVYAKGTGTLVMTLGPIGSANYITTTYKLTSDWRPYQISARVSQDNINVYFGLNGQSVACDVVAPKLVEYTVP